VFLGDYTSLKYRLEPLLLNKVYNLVTFIPPFRRRLGFSPSLQNVVSVKVCYYNYL
jgi:hypothetical protein